MYTSEILSRNIIGDSQSWRSVEESMSEGESQSLQLILKNIFIFAYLETTPMKMRFRHNLKPINANFNDLDYEWLIQATQIEVIFSLSFL